VSGPDLSSIYLQALQRLNAAPARTPPRRRGLAGTLAYCALLAGVGLSIAACLITSAWIFVAQRWGNAAAPAAIAGVLLLIAVGLLAVIAWRLQPAPRGATAQSPAPDQLAAVLAAFNVNKTQALLLAALNGFSAGLKRD